MTLTNCWRTDLSICTCTLYTSTIDRNCLHFAPFRCCCSLLLQFISHIRLCVNVRPTISFIFHSTNAKVSLLQSSLECVVCTVYRLVIVYVESVLCVCLWKILISLHFACYFRALSSISPMDSINSLAWEWISHGLFVLNIDWNVRRN